jgi:hypothetical protein
MRGHHPPGASSCDSTLASKLEVARVEIAAERDDRKVVSVVLGPDELPVPLSITIDVRPNEPARLQLSEIVVD